MRLLCARTRFIDKKSVIVASANKNSHWRFTAGEMPTLLEWAFLEYNCYTHKKMGGGAGGQRIYPIPVWNPLFNPPPPLGRGLASTSNAWCHSRQNRPSDVINQRP